MSVPVFWFRWLSCINTPEDNLSLSSVIDPPLPAACAQMLSTSRRSNEAREEIHTPRPRSCDQDDRMCVVL